MGYVRQSRVHQGRLRDKERELAGIGCSSEGKGRLADSIPSQHTHAMNAHHKTPQRIGVGFLLVLFLALASTGRAAEQKLGFAVDLKGEGFFLNPIVTTILVSEVTKGGLAEAAGMRVGDQIIQLEGEKVAGMRALGLRQYMKLDPGETRRLRLKHADGTEVDVRITKPKG